MGATPRKSNPVTAAERYAIQGPTGFLHPVHEYAVYADMKLVHSGRNKRTAILAFRNWSKIAPHRHIRHLRDGGQINERKAS